LLFVLIGISLILVFEIPDALQKAVFGAPGLHRPWTSVSISTAESGLKKSSQSSALGRFRRETAENEMLVFVRSEQQVMGISFALMEVQILK
jgi:hypothetical protein